MLDSSCRDVDLVLLSVLDQNPLSAELDLSRDPLLDPEEELDFPFSGHSESQISEIN